LSDPFSHWKVYAGIVWAAFLAFGRRRWRLTLLFMGVAIALSDFLSSQVIKKLVRRPRLLGGGTFSFPSSHAANFLSLSTFVFLRNRKLWPLLVLGLLIGFSRVYVGAHYPLDVVAGGILGAALGYVTFILRGIVGKKMPERLRGVFPTDKPRIEQESEPTDAGHKEA
jgi:undecaprenyl-diphosphatase